MHQFSVGVQRELPGRLALDVSYVGSRTSGLPVSKGINEITAEQLATGAVMLQPVPNPYQGLLPGTPFNGATVPRQQLVRPYLAVRLASPRIAGRSASTTTTRCR